MKETEVFDMSKVLFINFMGEGHINPSLGLVRELIKRGEEIIYYTSDVYKKRIEKTGAEVRSISQRAQSFLQEFLNTNIKYRNNSDSKKYMPQMMEMMEWITDEILEEIKTESFDYMIYDAQGIPGKWISHIKNIPSVATWTTFAMNQHSHLFHTFAKQNDLQELKSIEEMKENLRIIRSRLEQKYAIPIPIYPQIMLNEGDFNIVFTSRSFQPESELFDKNHLFVGPSLMERPDQSEFPFDELKNGTLVYMALGTVVNNRPDLYKICIEALKNLDIKVVLSIGNQFHVTELDPLPDNFIVRNYVPQLEVLRHSDAFITHCGMNSANEGIFFGNPLVMLPLVNDQPLVANRVKEKGAGVLLDHQTVDATKLREAVIEVLNNPIYKQNSQKISQSFQEAGGYLKAADELLKRMNDQL